MAERVDINTLKELEDSGVMLVPLNPLQIAMVIHALRHMHTSFCPPDEDPPCDMTLLALELQRKTRATLEEAVRNG